MKSVFIDQSEWNHQSLIINFIPMGISVFFFIISFISQKLSAKNTHLNQLKVSMSFPKLQKKLPVICRQPICLFFHFQYLHIKKVNFFL